MQTVNVQNNCTPQTNPSCPADAIIELEVERLNGNVGNVAVSAIPTQASWVVAEFILGSFDGDNSGSTLDHLLANGTNMAIETVTYRMRAPDYAMNYVTLLPYTFNINMRAYYEGNSIDYCEIPAQITVSP